MQDRYAFDIGDYSKLGLLLGLMGGDSGRRLGVIWYAVRTAGADAARNDGRFVDYLNPVDEFGNGCALRDCNRGLYDAFREAIEAATPRSIASLEAVAPWPGSTRFFSECVPGTRDRPGWFARARSVVEGCDLVFCDQDNGIAAPGSVAEAKLSPKHILPGETAELFDGGASLLLYHHYDRSESHRLQSHRIAEIVAARCITATEVIPLRFTRRSPRLYVLVVRPEHATWLRAALGRMQDGPWFRGGHFELVK